MARRFTIQPVWFDPVEDTYEPRQEETYPGQFPYEWTVPTWPLGHPNAGHPKYAFGFVASEGPKNLLASVLNTYVLPEYPLDGLMSAMEPSEKAAMVQSLESYDFGELLTNGTNNLDATVQEPESFREFLDRIVKQIDPAQSIDGLEL